MKRILIAMSLAAICSPLNVHAAPKACESTKFSLLTADVKFGTTRDEAYKILQKAMLGKAIVRNNTEKSVIEVNFNKGNQMPFDFVVYEIKGGVVVKIVWSYSNAFQDKLGGPSDALLSIVKKAREKYGMNETSDQLSNGFELSWTADNGASMEIMGKDPYTIVVRIECEPLKEEMTRKEAENTNFGF